jgi:SulP family sulfate permease
MFRIGKSEFSRLELAGSLGDVGTLLPLAMGMILVNGLSASGVFFSVGLFYILAGRYYGVTTPVQPMKVIGAYALATAADALHIQAAGILMGLVLLIIGAGGLIEKIQRHIPKVVVRGVQLTTGTLLMTAGVKFIVGKSSFQEAMGRAEPWLFSDTILGLPLGVLLGIFGGALALILLDNKRLPAGLILVAGGALLGAALGAGGAFLRADFGIFLPDFFPLGLPAWSDFVFVLPVLVLPQLPMTLGNAVIANADLAKEYFGPDSRRVTPRALCLSMAFANGLAALFGGMPMCHGAGGLAAHHRFGARTAGSNYMIGGLFMTLAIFFGNDIVAVVNLLPISVLGVLLVFAGSNLALQIGDICGRREMFTAMVMLGISLATSLTWGFLAGIVLTKIMKSDQMSV